MNNVEALSVMNKYGFNSVDQYPYLYNDGVTIGVVCLLEDKLYGSLERIFVFENSNSFDSFLKKYRFYLDNKDEYNIQISLDDYELVNPNIIYSIDGRILKDDEIFNCEKSNLDEIDKLLIEAERLLNFYDLVKSEQTSYFIDILNLKNNLRKKYYDLQLKVDKINGEYNDRVLHLFMDNVSDYGFNTSMEMGARDRFDNYKEEKPSLEEALDYIEELWDLNLNLELNDYYFSSLMEEKEINYEMVLVNDKLDLVNRVLESNNFFGVNLVKKFKSINDIHKGEKIELDSNFKMNAMDNIKRKYSYFKTINKFNCSIYLREVLHNPDYAGVASKFVNEIDEVVKSREDILLELKNSYTKSLQMEQQALLTMFNSVFGELFKRILAIPSFETVSVQEIINKLNTYNDNEFLKKMVFDDVIVSLNKEENSKMRSSLFAYIKVDSYENYISSIRDELVKLKTKGLIYLDGKLKMHMMVESVKDIYDMDYLYLNGIKSNMGIICNVELNNLNVLYSPYLINFDGKVSLKSDDMIKLYVDTKLVSIINNEELVLVNNYTSNKELMDGIYMVKIMNIVGVSKYLNVVVNGR